MRLHTPNNTKMKLPQSVIDGAIQIGSKKYALFSAITVVDIEDDDDGESAMVYRDGEINSISFTPEAGYRLEEATVIPVNVKAKDIQGAIDRFGIELRALANRIIESETPTTPTDEAP